MSAAVVIPNWNGREDLPACLDSLRRQTLPVEVIVVENGSTDGSVEMLRESYPDVTVLVQAVNLGFAGGVNAGIRYALHRGHDAIALLNNDAVADAEWMRALVAEMSRDDRVGMVASKFVTMDGARLDSTGECYSTWGLPFPRGRGEERLDAYDEATELFGASGGSTLYRADMLRDVGLFDEDFFAYFEDVDLSWRAQLRGWRVRLAPDAIAYHRIGATSGRIPGFTTYQTLKNLLWLATKNVPLRLLPTIAPRLAFAYSLTFARAVLRGQGVTAVRALAVAAVKMPKKLRERRVVQAGRRAGDDVLRPLLTWDLPPGSTNLRRVRSMARRVMPWRERGRARDAEGAAPIDGGGAAPRRH
ncbi:glycosyltransferase family 2 protein [Microbacterium trichothecenolyticum]|uniref:GT2 family glycosyltransferase n=1 Tax=Microbacterium trichothecenolyticum TaxID=69370 RepID=A0ABU0TVI0_MICTR|nr:glycosyltransferase family 2 protein [Microbacterium trichothecenolyticum]MDQ1123673.1 GT2 family glycosyltransferase [Microbacterium trichothecenolyticum]